MQLRGWINYGKDTGSLVLTYWNYFATVSQSRRSRGGRLHTAEWGRVPTCDLTSSSSDGHTEPEETGKGSTHHFLLKCSLIFLRVWEQKSVVKEGWCLRVHSQWARQRPTAESQSRPGLCCWLSPANQTPGSINTFAEPHYYVKSTSKRRHRALPLIHSWLWGSWVPRGSPDPAAHRIYCYRWSWTRPCHPFLQSSIWRNTNF